MTINDLIDEAIATGDSLDPRAIALNVSEQVRSKDLRDTVLELLPARVRERIHVLRAAAFRRTTEPTGEGNAQPVSAKWEAARAVFAQAYCVDGTWKPLGDHSAEDIQWHVGDYHKRAEENEAWAKKFGLLADLMRQQRVALVRELDEEEVRAVMQS